MNKAEAKRTAYLVAATQVNHFVGCLSEIEDIDDHGIQLLDHAFGELTDWLVKRGQRRGPSHLPRSVAEAAWMAGANIEQPEFTFESMLAKHDGE